MEDSLCNASQGTLDDLQDLIDLYHLWQMALYEEKTSRPARVWAEDWNLRRTSEVPIYKEFEEDFPSKFQTTFRMSKEVFYLLLSKVEHLITKKDTPKRLAIPAKMRLQLTLKYLASGLNYKSLEEIFRYAIHLLIRGRRCRPRRRCKKGEKRKF
jgi:hypothetical protein